MEKHPSEESEPDRERFMAEVARGLEGERRKSVTGIFSGAYYAVAPEFEVVLGTAEDLQRELTQQHQRRISFAEVQESLTVDGGPFEARTEGEQPVYVAPPFTATNVHRSRRPDCRPRR